MSYRIIAKYKIFGDASKKESINLEKKCKFSEDIMDISPKNNTNQEKTVTISEYMNDKIEDSEIAIEKLKKDLEKSLAIYNK